MDFNSTKRLYHSWKHNGLHAYPIYWFKSPEDRVQCDKFWKLSRRSKDEDQEAASFLHITRLVICRSVTARMIHQLMICLHSRTYQNMWHGWYAFFMWPLEWSSEINLKFSIYTNHIGFLPIDEETWFSAYFICIGNILLQ